MPDCLCRTDPSSGRRWINVSCRSHGLASTADEPDAEVADLVGNAGEYLHGDGVAE